MRRSPALALAVLLLLVLATFAAPRVSAQEKAPSTDAAITKRVETALAKDKVLAVMDIKVATLEGIVSLTGFVRSLEDITRAGGLVKNVPGVFGVRNDLRVANRPSQA